nr:D-alanine--D-alanine ligase [Fimbriimonas ginsengisoli]
MAVTGTHGKTTTTGMTGAGLIAAGLDPLVVVGAAIPEWGGPVRYGNGEYAVVEACEAYDALHDLDPYIVILTNLELDHVDFHGNYENLRASILRFVDRIPKEGGLVFCADDPGAEEVAKLTTARTFAYGHTGTWFRLAPDAGKSRPSASEAAGRTIGMSTPGEHNRLNGAGAFAASLLLNEHGLKVDPWQTMEGIFAFSGAERRLQLLRDGDFTVVDDYAHHPSEIHASLTALRERYAGRRLVVVFQPHLYSRTAPLIQEFADALSEADVVVLTDIYPAREDPMPGISSARIAEKISKPVHYVPSRHLLPRKVAKFAQEGDVIVGMGAGNISEFAPALVKELERPSVGALPPKSASIDDIGGGAPPLRRKVVVLYGGDSAEREVSLHSGRAIHAALQSRGYDSRLVDMTELLLGKGDLGQFIGAHRPDVAFLAVHGTHAEDGAIQGLLELLHIPYTGSGIQASAIAMDKAMTKQVLQSHGIRVPRGALLTDTDVPFDLRPPLIVKPNAQGSTVGLTFVEKPDDLCPALANAFAYDDSVLVEEWITGVEISVPVLIDRALPPVEIAPNSGRYDFASKYLPGATNEIIPARLPEKVLEEARQIAMKAHRALRCEGATRTDMMVRNAESESPEIFVLEINTLPGMTGTSLLPNSAAAAGIPFDQLCQTLLEDALRRDAAKY